MPRVKKDKNIGKLFTIEDIQRTYPENKYVLAYGPKDTEYKVIIGVYDDSESADKAKTVRPDKEQEFLHIVQGLVLQIMSYPSQKDDRIGRMLSIVEASLVYPDKYIFLYDIDVKNDVGKLVGVYDSFDECNYAKRHYREPKKENSHIIYGDWILKWRDYYSDFVGRVHHAMMYHNVSNRDAAKALGLSLKAFNTYFMKDSHHYKLRPHLPPMDIVIRLAEICNTDITSLIPDKDIGGINKIKIKHYDRAEHIYGILEHYFADATESEKASVVRHVHTLFKRNKDEN